MIVSAPAIEWTPLNFLLSGLLLLGELATLGPRFYLKALDPYTGRLRPGKTLWYTLGFVASFFGAMGLCTLFFQGSRVEQASAEFVSAETPVSITVHVAPKGETLKVRLLGVAPIEPDPNGLALAYLRSLVRPHAPLNLQIAARTPQGASAYVFTSWNSGSDLGVLMAKAGMVRYDPGAPHAVYNIESLQRSETESAQRRHLGLWRTPPP
jgi:endonuclease YncB( thermonuclease family)